MIDTCILGLFAVGLLRMDLNHILRGYIPIVERDDMQD